MNRAALPHVRVLEFADGLQAAYCGKQFAAWGSDVVVVEPPSGSPVRDARPLAPASNGLDLSLTWEYVAAGKRSTTIDLADRRARRGLRRLLRGADALVTDWSPARLEESGLGFDLLERQFPGLVVVSITPFGLDGPYSAFEGGDLVAQALSGYMSLNGSPGLEPLKAPANVLAYACGVSAFVAALAGIRERQLSGRGQVVELSCVEAIASIVPFLRTEYTGIPFARSGGPAGGTTMFRCRDGYVSFLPLGDRTWPDILLGLEIEPTDVPESLQTAEGRKDLKAMRAFLSGILANHRAEDVFHALNSLRSVCGIDWTPAELLTNAHLRAREFFRELDHPQLGRILYPGPPARLSRTPMVPVEAAPDPYGEARWRRRTGRRTQATARTLERPLTGLRVIDLTHAWIGTYATMCLADLGADVVKVEAISHPDVWRGIESQPQPRGARPTSHPWNTSSLFNSVNRNKRSVVLELHTLEGRELFLRLVRDADLVAENFTPRVMENFGLGYDALRAVNPDLVMVSYSGFGASGPFRDYRANGATTETQSGWDALLGYPGGPPMMMGNMQADAITGLQMAATALVAVAHRDRTGEGQRVEGSMFEAAIGYIGEEVLRASLAGEAESRRGNRHPGMAPHSAFPCTGDDEWIAIAVRDDADWQALRSFAGPGAGLNDPRFDSTEGRLANVETLEAALTDWTRGWPARDLMSRLQTARVPAGVVQRTNEVFDDAHFQARDWFTPLDHADLGVRRYNGFPWRLSRTPPLAVLPPPRLGEHSAEVLTGELGLSENEYRSLVAKQVTGSLLDRPARSDPAPG